MPEGWRSEPGRDLYREYAFPIKRPTGHKEIKTLCQISLHNIHMEGELDKINNPIKTSIWQRNKWDGFRE